MISGGLGDFAGSLRMISGGCFLGCNPKMMLLSLGSTGAYTRNLMGKITRVQWIWRLSLTKSTFHRGIGDGCICCMMDNLMQDLCTHVHPKSLTKDKPNEFHSLHLDQMEAVKHGESPRSVRLYPLLLVLLRA